MEAISILDEIGDDLGLVLWRSARNVALWAQTPADQRAALFAGDAALARVDALARARAEAELLAPLSVVADLLARPAAADVLRVVNACRRISLWAEQRGYLATALEFAQAAAQAAPDSAALAYAVGRLARRRAEYDRAESWYTRAAVQGRATRDWRSYALAFSGMGNLHVQRGNYPAARRAHLRCLRVAERKGLPELMGDAYHDLFAVAAETHAGFEADALAERAFRAYGARNPKVLRLAYDVAYHWVLLGSFGSALRVAEGLLRHFSEPADRTLVLALIARAAGGVANVARYETATDETRVMLLRASTEDVAARALLGLAHGALSLGEVSTAIQLASQSASIANRRSEWRVAMEAEVLLDSARSGATAERARVVATQKEPALADPFVEVLSASDLTPVGIA